MRSQLTTLFTDVPTTPPRASAIPVSLLAHAVVGVWLYLGLRYVPRINDQPVPSIFTVRILKQDSIHDPISKRSAGGQTRRTAESAGSPTPMPAVATDLAQLIAHTQTLIQPDAPMDKTLTQEIPVPMVVRWSTENLPERAIVLPLPKTLTAADIRPTLTPPNREVMPADIKISASTFTTNTPSLPPSTTTPIVVRAAAPTAAVPESSSQSLSQPTPAQVISLSDLRLKEGSITLPAVNIIPANTANTPLISGQSTESNSAGNGNPVKTQDGAGMGQAATRQTERAQSDDGPGAGSSGARGNGGGSAASGSAPGPSITHISLPQDGKFGVVVVGSAIAEQYPESVSVWKGRLIYTVYLRVGTGKNWILQYSMPRTADVKETASVARPEAPWPYDISRPDLAPGDVDADAIMVHGLVNLSGRFEQLALVFPTEFAQAKFVLNALQQWKFRPAKQNGQIAAVEVLVIIPQVAE